MIARTFCGAGDGTEAEASSIAAVRAVQPRVRGRVGRDWNGDTLPTINQLVRKGRKRILVKGKSPALRGNPRSASQLRLPSAKSPPGSAKWRVRLTNGIEVTAHIPVKDNNPRNTRSC